MLTLVMYSSGTERDRKKDREYFIASQCNNFQTVCFKKTTGDKPHFTV